MKPLVMIFAGNYKQFAEWTNRQLVNFHFRYVADTSSLMGMRGCELKRIGTWYKRSDRHDIDREIVLNGLVEQSTPTKPEERGT